MAYIFQTFTINQILTNSQMNQVEVNIRDHQHGISAGVSTTVGTLTPDADNSKNLGSVSLRFANVWGVNIQAGDIKLDNGWVITEFGQDVVFINPDKQPVLKLSTDGTLERMVQDG